MAKKRKVAGFSDIRKKPVKKRLTAREREELLIENFVGLQKAMINLSIKFEKLSDHIAKLLHIFELSAKNFMEGSSSESDKDLLKKIDSLLDQNKTIAKGLVLMEDKLRGKLEAPMSRPQFQQPPQFSGQRPQKKPQSL